MKKYNKVFALLLCLTAFLAFALGSGTNSSNNSGGARKSNTTAAKTQNTIDSSQNTIDSSKYHTYNYTDIARRPNDYKGKLITFSGKVIQVRESSLFGTTTVTLRINEDGDYDKTWYAEYTRNNSSEDRILEDDTVTVYGKCEGVESYTTVLGSQVTIPSVSVEKIELGKNVNGKLVVFNAAEVIKALKVKEYSYSNSWTRYHFVEAENTSSFDIDLTINVKYYDKDNNLVGVDSMNEKIQAKGNALLYDMPDEKYATTKLEYEVKECSYSKPVQAELSYDVIKKSDKLIVTVKNNSDASVKYVEAKVLFFKGDELIYYSSTYINDSDYEIKAGKECSDEIKCLASKKTFDNYKIYISGTK